MANTGPPKKRHKGWSPESIGHTETVRRNNQPVASNTVNGTKPGTHLFNSILLLTDMILGNESMSNSFKK